MRLLFASWVFSHRGVILVVVLVEVVELAQFLLKRVFKNPSKAD